MQLITLIFYFPAGHRRKRECCL